MVDNFLQSIKIFRSVPPRCRRAFQKLRVGWACVLVGWTCVFVGWGVLVGVWLGVGGLGVLVGVWSGVGGFGRVGWGVVDAQNMINTVSHLIEDKKSKDFGTLFLKKFYKFLSSYRTKIRFSNKIFSDHFLSLTKRVSQLFALIQTKKTKKNFDPIFQKFFTSFCPPYRAKISNFKKKFFSDNFFLLKKHVSHKIHID